MVRERFAGIRIIKAYTREENERLRLAAVSRNYLDRNLQLVRITGSFFPLMMFFSNLSLTLVLLLGGRETILTNITAGDFVAFISYLGLLTWPMMALGWVTNLIQRGKASLDRINTILEVQPRIADRPGAVALGAARGRVAFESVDFSYGPGQSPALEQVSFDLVPGRMLGIVGPPGSGKTTLLGLIARLYDVTGGRILLDRIDVRQLRLADLRAQIALVPQEPFLFAGSIYANITFNAPDIASARLQAVLEAAGLTDTIADLPRGLDTVVGERGVTLSGGQKQRVGLARALLQDPPLLILDDPISQVDTQTGHIILNALKTQARRKTLLVASHRLAAVQFADTIITLDNGRVIQSGTHTELMAAGGYYARTFNLQAVEEEF